MTILDHGWGPMPHPGGHVTEDGCNGAVMHQRAAGPRSMLIGGRLPDDALMQSLGRWDGN
jgi:hypothetical protein